MGSRYWITGAQLGILQEMTKEKREKLIEEIIDNQFIGNVSTYEERLEFKKAVQSLEGNIKIFLAVRRMKEKEILRD